LEDSSFLAWKREIASGWGKWGSKEERRGAVVSACVFPEKEPVGRRLENGGREGKNPGRSEEATRR